MRLRSMVLAGLLLFVAFTTSALAPVSQGITENVRVVRGGDHTTVVLLPVMIHGQGPFTFQLDTGASTSLISPSLVRWFGLQSVGEPQTIRGIGGTQQATPVSISNWNTGLIRLPAANIVSAALPHEYASGLYGLIGSDIWSRFGSFTLDYNTGTLTVYRQIVAAPRLRTGAPALGETTHSAPMGGGSSSPYSYAAT